MALTINGTSGLVLESVGSRITGDFSNTDSGFSRTMFQSRVADGATHVFAMPNSTANLATFGAISSNTPNHNAIWIQASSSGGVLSATRGGTASYPPMIFGTSDTERMRLAANGNFGVGTTTPVSRLMVSSSGAMASTLVGNTVNAGLHLTASDYTTGYAGSSIIWSNYGTGGTTTQSYISGGTYGINALSFSANGSSEHMRIDSTGNVTAAGNVTAYSDIKLKTDIQTIDNALDKVLKMRGVMYTRLDTGLRGTGVVAQEIKEVLPEVVIEGETLSVAYGNIVGVLIEAIKELKAEIEQLKGK
jgi:Chaperone of endosialidase